ncbi:Universal stress protein, UspA family [Cupriavidus necator]|uniref:Universal stress protein n=1 Tax=Cupriavidus necator (strain ATCC 17699 / DSM 428 / KCTC 22496 / NCIMB 10442 / H16 / Stanier 337) TaxID=381666 RepID=Q0KA50_CUPNH|nr:universal stress protein [Cupriavidus necator]KUE86975.1 universal stress protein UspA [Cupriavidus necator]QCC00950.1 universal stress protein [Cupriavidus necator H16]QQB76223.1 universal stress protein [Cupriavidus necator]WKA39319.1 universal stress protein [Cupriavidus necator]CAJ93121.1 universal stress protein, UspA family [Cupriavidus necator H16]
MDFRTILVDLSEDSARSARIETAARVAAKFGGSVVGLTATGTNLEPFRGAGEEAGQYAALAASQLHKLVAGHKETLDTLTRQVSPDIPTRHIIIDAESGWALADEGRFADLILPAPPSADADVPALLAGVAEYAMLNAGRPILLVPGAAGPRFGGHVAIAWNGGREAARAVADALPWLAHASAVTALVVSAAAIDEETCRDSGNRLTAWLASHGINADLVVGEGDPDHVLPQLACKVQADLLVAGGYGRSRLKELVLGGTTRALVRQSSLPVFMSH